MTLLLEKPTVKGELSDDVVARFRQRVLESHDNTQQAINIRLDWPSLRDKPLNFAQAEQGLLAGHAFHPAPKSHQPFNEKQAQRYLPILPPASHYAGLQSINATCAAIA